jgi:hypothetical protein
MGRTNYLIAVIKGDKVVNLHWSKALEELDTIKMLNPNCIVEVTRPVDGIMEKIVNPVHLKPYSRNGKSANNVICVETGEVYVSVRDCSNKTGIPQRNIYQSIRQGGYTRGVRFKYYCSK